MNTKNIDPLPSATLDLDRLDATAQAELAKYLTTPLDALVEGIKASQTEIAQCKGKIDVVRDHVRESAIVAGFQFLAVRCQLPKGEKFGTYVKACEVSWATANRYMGLAANSAHVRNLPSGTSLRKAYLAAGVVKPPGKPKESAPQLAREIMHLKFKVIALAKKADASDIIDLAKRIRSLEKVCSKVALKLEVSQPAPRLRIHREPRFSRHSLKLSPLQVDTLSDLQLAGFFREQ